MSQQNNNANATHWKSKYLDSLDQQERQQKKSQLILTLLNQTIIRISRIAQGIDPQLDKQLEALLTLLKAETIAGKELKLIAEALNGHVKRIEANKTANAQQLAQALATLIAQIKSLKIDGDDKKKLKTFSLGIKARSHYFSQYSQLISDYAQLQQELINRFKAAKPKESFWQRLVARKAVVVNETEPVITEEPVVKKPAVINTYDAEEIQYVDLDCAVGEDSGALLPRSEWAVPDDTVAEPLSRMHDSASEILKELLAQIEPPPLAKANYEQALGLLDQGLNDYELIATLEQVSLVIVSAFDRDQQAFESFLNQLNDRLTAAYSFIADSQHLQGQRSETNKLLRDSMRGHVEALQQSVAVSHDLEQLKTEVSNRLDQVLSAIDQHQSSETMQDKSLSKQLNDLVEQVKTMEQQGKEAEARIEEQRQRALRDVLTQLPNREAYQQRLEQEAERWLRYQRPLTLVVCDIDFFKKINDNYGHQAGDKVLRIIARSLAIRLRKTDFIARYGGEEFVILMPETAQEPAKKVIENIREAIAACPFHFKEQPVSITLSFGVSEFTQDDKAEMVFARADKALYQAKAAGRNRVIVAETKATN